MKTFLVIAVTNIGTLFIYDTYNDYIVTASTENEAMQLSKSIPHLIEIDSIKEIDSNSAAALMKTNRTKNINEHITQVILF